MAAVAQELLVLAVLVAVPLSQHFQHQAVVVVHHQTAAAVMVSPAVQAVEQLLRVEQKRVVLVTLAAILR